MDKDLEHLRLLSIFYYINAGISALFACFPVLHLAMGITIVLGGFSGGKDPMPTFVGWFFIIFASVFILVGWALAFASYLTAKYLKQQKNHLFCLIVAGINCAFFPTGTVLGVFTFIVLLRDPVKQLFNRIPQGEFQPAMNLDPPGWK